MRTKGLYYLFLLFTFFNQINFTSAQSNVEGEWSNPINMGIVPVAVANLPDGRLLCWSSQFRNTFIEAGDGATFSQYFDYRLNNGLGGVDGAEFTMNTDHDMFCPGINNLPDGRLLSAGGTSSSKTSIFDPSTGYWSVASEMNIPRGYQGNVTMSDGNVFTVGGSWSQGASNNGGKDAEIWSPTTGWITLPEIQGDDIYTGNDLATEEQGVYRSDNHVWLWPAPDAPNKIFHAGPSEEMHWIDPFATDASGNLVGEMLNAGFRQDAGETDGYSMKGNTVMYDTGKILKIGGATQYGVDFNTTTLARSNSFEIDLNGVVYGQNPNVTFTGNMAYERIYHNSTVLPDGKVLVTGGSTVAALFSDTYAVLEAELFDPEAPAGNKWSTVGAMQEARTYHSVAILMPDARVFVGGGGLCDGSNPNCENHFNAEIYSPPYLFDTNGDLATRPEITNFTGGNSVGTYGEIVVDYNTTLSLSTDVNISEFSLIRFSAATHSTNNEQRRISLTGSGNTSHSLSIPDRNILPPGFYMLFAIDNNGVPSIAETLKIGDALPLPIANNPNLVLELNFDETSGINVADSSGNNNNGTIVQRDDNGNPVAAVDHQFVSGLFGNAIEFDGKEFQSNSIIEMDNSSSFQTLQDKVTMSAWVYRDIDAIVPEDNNKIANVAVFAHDYPTNFFGFHNSLYKWSFQTTNGFVNVYSGYAPLAGWNHIAGVYNGETLKLYANGVQIGQGSITGNLTGLADGSDFSKMTVSGFYDGNIDNNRILPIKEWGNESGITDEVDGRIDDFKIYNVALGAEEIANIFKEGLATNNSEVPNCEGNYLTVEYKIGTGNWQTSTTNRIVANEGDEIFIRAKDFNGEYFITTSQYDGPTFNTVNDTDKLTTEGAYQIDTFVNVSLAPWNNADRGNGLLDSSNNGFFVLTTPEGCPTAIELEVLGSCDPGDTEIFAEFQINGVWCDNPNSAFPCGSETITIDEGTKLIISATPNSNTNPEVYPLTIKLPNGISTGDNYTIESVDSLNDSGIYTIISAEGCSKTLEVIINEIDCATYPLQSEYQINGGTYVPGQSSVDVNVGDRLILSVTPNNVPFSIVSNSTNNNNKVNGTADLVIESIDLNDAGTYIFTTSSGCSTELTVNVGDPDCTSLDLETQYQINSFGPYISGATQVTLDEGNNITLSILPDQIPFSINSTSVNGNQKDFNTSDLDLSNVTTNDAGLYTFTTGAGCVVELEVIVNTVDCTALDLQTEYEINDSGNFVVGENEVRTAIGDDILLSVFPNQNNGTDISFEVRNPGGIIVKPLNPGDFILGDIQESDEGIYTMTSSSGCEITIIVLVGLNDSPAANIIATPLSGTAPLEVNFDASGTTDDGLIASYSWDFGDGNTATGETATNTFTNEGIFTVTLTVEDTEGAQNSTTVEINVSAANEAPVADATATPLNGQAPLEVSFSAANSTDDNGIVSYAWDFGDGIGTSTEENPVYTYATDGIFTAILTVTDAEGLEDTANIEITVTPANEAPIAVAEATPVSGIVPLEVNFNAANSTDDAGIVSYAWDFGDGSSVVTIENPTHTYTASGNFTATLTVTDAQGLENSDTVAITVETPDNQAPTAVVDATPTTGTTPLEVVFSSDGSTDDKSIVSFAWDFGDGTGNSTEENPTYTYTTSGDFTATLTVTDAEGLQNTASILITVDAPNEAPVADASATPLSGNAPLEVSFSSDGSTDDTAIVSYTWDFGDGSGTSTEENPTYTYTTIGNYTATLTVTDAEGLEDTATVEISVTENTGGNQAPSAIASATPLTGNAPLEVSFSSDGSSDDTAIVSYTWDFGDGSGTSTEENPTYTYTTIGNYTATLTVTDAEGLADTATVEISVTENTGGNQAPSAIASATPLTGNAPLEVSFSSDGSTDDTAIVSYTWDFGDGSGTSTEENPAYTYTTVGVFTATLTVTDAEGLEDSATVTITVEQETMNQAPEAVATATPISGEAPLEVAFSSVGSSDDDAIASYSWDFGTGDTSNDENPIYVFQNEGEYTVTLTVTDTEGLTNTAELEIIVIENDPTAIEQNVTIAPNPATTTANIFVENPEGILTTKIGLYDAAGKLIYTFVPSDVYNNATDSYELPITILTNGLYMVKIEFNQGDPESIKLLVRK
ncbi:hypothetical protein GCM10011414_10190 [Croceivirga lutea]|uniref:PKD domain-containing protein n=1 Tax=Croceivirga lutea TaxID=1775167 RepID=UPI001639B6C8|nr:PKD domain-containing protein [Croceivirga lutea]GGG42569.1 hypothetical protein GCM10011414_10190 [Croceivirga lutea]